MTQINSILSSVFTVSILVSCSGSDTTLSPASGGAVASGGTNAVTGSSGGSVLNSTTTRVVGQGGSSTTTGQGTGSSVGGTQSTGGTSFAISTGGKSTVGIGGATKGGSGSTPGGTKSTGGTSAAGGTKTTGGSTSVGGTTADFCATPFKFKTPFMDGTIYTADPSAHVFNGKVYVYPSHDQANNPAEDSQANQFNMVDYHVYSTDLKCWPVTDHGMKLRVEDVPWAAKQMWAPDAAYKNNKYYLYFPARAKSDSNFHIGVATGPSPIGPFTAEANYIPGSTSIDPAVFVDDDGSAYMYFGGKEAGQLPASATGPRMAKMSDDMLSFSGSVTDLSISGATTDNSKFYEGSWVHKYNNTYYLSYSTGATHILAYATSTSPTGPFTYKGTLLNAVTSGWTTHHSVIKYDNKWYLFYADSTCSGGVTPRRCVKVQELTYNGDAIKALSP